MTRADFAHSSALAPSEPRRGRRTLLRLLADEQLLVLSRGGSDEAFAALAHRHRRRLLAYARHMLGTPTGAEDVTREVLARAHASLRTAEAGPAALRPWLFGIAHRCCLERAAAQRRSPGDRSPQHLLDDIDSLPAAQRSALIMREQGGLTYDELAGALDATVPAVEALLVSARMSLAASRQQRADPSETARPVLGCRS